MVSLKCEGGLEVPMCQRRTPKVAWSAPWGAYEDITMANGEVIKAAGWTSQMGSNDFPMQSSGSQEPP